MPGVGVLELLWVLAIAAIFLAVPIALARADLAASLRTTTSVAMRAPDPALDALRSRLATGEIDEAEFRRLQSVLHGG